MTAEQIPLVACAVAAAVGIFLLLVGDDGTANGTILGCLGKIVGAFLVLGGLGFGALLLITQGWPF